MRTALYRLYDVNDVLLYIGISENPEARWKTHVSTAHWWPQVHRKTVEWHGGGCWGPVYNAEALAIKQERPVYNIAHSDWIAVLDSETGAVEYTLHPNAKLEPLVNSSFMPTKSELEGAERNLPEGLSRGKFLRACLRTLREDPEAILALVMPRRPEDRKRRRRIDESQDS